MGRIHFRLFPGSLRIVKAISNFCLLIAFIATSLAMPLYRVHAYSLIGSQWPQPGGLGTPITLTYSYQNMFDGGLLMPNGQPLPQLLIRDSIEEALTLWSSVAPIHFVEVPDDGKQYFESLAHGRIRFRHVYINGPDPPPPALPVAKAQAYYPNTSTNSGGDVEYDHGDRWQEVGTLPQPDILGATVHELGHSLGLAHTDIEEANLYWIFNRYSGLGTASLHQDDINGVRHIYGAGVGSLTPLVGTWQDRGILPTDVSGNGSRAAFANAPTSHWFATPVASEITFTAAPGTLFQQIEELPTGFDGPISISVGDIFLGQFNAGENVDFQFLPSGGVTSFVLSGIDPNAVAQSNFDFALKIGFTTSAGNFAVAAVPEPTTISMLAMVVAALASPRRRA
jgi:hypothetical protein